MAISKSVSSRSIFISYCHADGHSYATKLAHSLHDTCKYDVFFDDDILGGQVFTNRIEEQLNKATHLVLILTPGTDSSDWVRREIEHFSRLKKPIIPCYFKDCETSPIILESIQYIDFREKSANYNYKKALDKLCLSINGIPVMPIHPTWKQGLFIELDIHVPEENICCIPVNMRISDAYDIMVRSDNKYRHLPVTKTGTAGSKLVGILSLRHILTHNRLLLDEQRHPSNHEAKETVSELMDVFHPYRDPLPEPYFMHIRTNDTVEQALTCYTTLLSDGPAVGRYFCMSALPIIDEDDNLVGFASFKDVIKAMTVKHLIPTPNITLDQCMRKEIVLATENEDLGDIRMRLGQVGQRDAPIVDNFVSRRLQGWIPSHNMLGKTGPAKPVIVPFQNLHQQSVKTRLAEFLSEYIKENTIYFSFPVVDEKSFQSPPKLAGMMGYLELFRALLSYS